MKFAVALRAFGLAASLWLAPAEAAEPVSPLIGATRDQVLSRYGEPRNQMSAGDQLIFLYPRERIVFRGGVVIEVEAISPEPVRRPPTGETPTPDAPNPNDPNTAGTPVAPAGAGNESTPASRAAEAGPDGAASAPPPEPKVEIKLVRPPGSKDLPPAPPPATSPALAPAMPQPDNVVPPPPAETNPPSPGPATSAILANALTEANEARRAAERAAAAEKEQKDKARKDALRRLDEAASAEASSGSGFSGKTWLIVAGVLIAGVALIFWRSRRRPISFADAGAAGPAPGIGAAPANGANFTPEMIEDLNWNRFERLVIAYYSKTGVVAAPTHSGPDGAVQIKISWKGEPQPFAFVRCVSNAAGLVDVKPLIELGTALAADDIRRGYVVTPGRFTPAARNLATEKQLTLMPGDVLIEKLNALPVSARKELMREIGLG